LTSFIIKLQPSSVGYFSFYSL